MPLSETDKVRKQDADDAVRWRTFGEPIWAKVKRWIAALKWPAVIAGATFIGGTGSLYVRDMQSGMPVNSARSAMAGEQVAEDMAAIREEMSLGFKDMRSDIRDEMLTGFKEIRDDMKIAAAHQARSDLRLEATIAKLDATAEAVWRALDKLEKAK